MDLPKSVDDPCLLQHEPLRSYISAYKSLGESCSKAQGLIAEFAAAMQREENGQAAAAVRRWSCFLFEDVLSVPEGSLLEPIDGGKELYTFFFDYQFRLSEGLRDGSIDDARKFQDSVVGKGIAALKLILANHNARRSSQGRGPKGGSRRQSVQPSSRLYETPGPSNLRPPAQTGVQLADRENIEIGSNSGTQHEFSSDTHPAPGIPLSVLSEGPKPSRHSTFKRENKRKASSQKPPIITPSDASDDDKEPSKTQAALSADSVSHRSKRATASPRSQSQHEVKDQADMKMSIHKLKINVQYHEPTPDSQPLSPLTSLESDVALSPSGVEGENGAEWSLCERKKEEEGTSNVSTVPLRANCDPRKTRKIKSATDIRTDARKRLRRASMPALDGKRVKGSARKHDIRAKGPEGITVVPTSNHEDFAGAHLRRKRTRPETAVDITHKETLGDSREPLGPDPRPVRPPPRKVHSGRLVPFTDDDTIIRGVASSLEDAHQLTQSVVSNEAGSDLEDWTKDQDEEHDVDLSYLSVHDEDEANEVTTATPASSMIVHKPPVPAPPRIWALSRQEVCESLEYFRCYHGGVYSKDDIVRGYLLGAYAASRDIFHHDGKLIISHGGGKSQSIIDVRRGPKRYQTDQDQEASDKSVRALLKTCKDRRPIVLLADDKYALFPYDLTSISYSYVVLGLYWISHAWAERQRARDAPGYIVRWKFAFQWCEGQDDPWWVPQEEKKNITSPDRRKPTSSPGTCPVSTGGEPSTQCKGCQGQSPFIYQQGWMCLNPHCGLFWSVNGEEPNQLDYREEFLTLLPQKFERLPNIIPANVVEAERGVTTSYAFSKGWHCMKCGRLSCRFKWEHWECASCHFKQEVTGRIRFPKEFWNQRPSKGFLHSQVGRDSGIAACRAQLINLGPDKGVTNCLTFILPHDRGRIHLILGTPLTNGDADNIFQLYQQQASTGELKLRRYPLHNHRARGLLLTNYFSQNSGEPYRYVGGSGNTVPFDEAPDCVQRALALIKDRSNLTLGTNIPFNEILSVAYMERQKMSFHSDSERGLGPIVASLSLGSLALMHFRPHLSAGDPRNKSSYALTLILRHGDVLIMEGEGVQKFYEHTVVPMNFRVAATARCIGT